MRISDMTEELLSLELMPTANFLGSEKDLENEILDNLEEISKNCMWGDVLRYEQQYCIPVNKGRIIVDIMIWHTDGTGTAIEVKTGCNNRLDLLGGISQSLFYGMKLEKMLLTHPRLVIAAPVIDYQVYQIIKRYKLPISLLMVDGLKCIYLGNNDTVI